MRTDHLESQTDALAPLVTALIERAKREAADMLAEADSDAADVLAGARAKADALLAEARVKGESDAADVLATERARAEREARAVLLAAQEEAHEHVRRAARDAVSALRDDPVHPQLLAALRQRATEELGQGTTITELPRGGLQASLGDKHLEFALDGLADDLLDRIGGDLAELWAP